MATAPDAVLMKPAQGILLANLEEPVAGAEPMPMPAAIPLAMLSVSVPECHLEGAQVTKR